MTHDQHIESILRAAGYRGSPCGLNASWSCQAWELDVGRDDTGHYLIHEEEQGEYCLALYHYRAHDERIDVLAALDLHAAQDKQAELTAFLARWLPLETRYRCWWDNDHDSAEERTPEEVLAILDGCDDDEDVSYLRDLLSSGEVPSDWASDKFDIQVARPANTFVCPWGCGRVSPQRTCDVCGAHPTRVRDAG